MKKFGFVPFKKSWPYILILCFISFIAITFVVAWDFVPESELDTVFGNALGIEITARLMMFSIAMYSALTLIFVLTWTLIKWCINHIFVE